MSLSFDRILSSPYLRARETAEIVAAAMQATECLAVEEALSSGAHWDEVRRALSAREAADSILMVGHEPDLSKITAEIIGAGRGALGFGKGTLACVTVNAIPPTEPGLLRNLLRTEQLESLAG
jgi:phosphohistidine phosphatase